MLRKHFADLIVIPTCRFTVITQNYSNWIIFSLLWGDGERLWKFWYSSYCFHFIRSLNIISCFMEKWNTIVSAPKMNGKLELPIDKNIFRDISNNIMELAILRWKRWHVQHIGSFPLVYQQQLLQDRSRKLMDTRKLIFYSYFIVMSIRKQKLSFKHL